MAGPLALRFLCIENLARWARLGKLLGLWPEERKTATSKLTHSGYERCFAALAEAAMGISPNYSCMPA
ncbi:hypothetical protein Rcae01_06464 [Novipirellula caenicola]|uniref:Uncharacterized protein n=1 Tax=Novipirellula caenicola TaxID=1536901 RepID=A0ABP9W464_9BACT